MDIWLWALASLAAFYGITAVYVIAQAALGAWLGVRVERVAIGLVVFKWLGLKWRWRGCEWQIGAWPFTGYTKFVASDDAAENIATKKPEAHRCFDDLDAAEKIAIVTIGPLANLLLGAVLLAMPVLLASPQLKLTTAAAKEIEPVAVSGLALAESGATFSGQMRFVAEIFAFLAPRYAYVQSIADCGGFIGAFVTFGAVGRESFGGWLTCMATLAIINGGVNLFPIPVLNGGHVVFCLWHALTGRPISEKWQIRWTLVGMVVALLVMARIIFADAWWLLRQVAG